MSVGDCCNYNVLFLLCYVVLRDLLSFPTRRSSDLWFCPAETLRCRANRRCFSDSPGASEKSLLLRTTPCFRRGNASLRPDRKSTRMNSSHRCISYAVFCLKKNILMYIIFFI